MMRMLLAGVLALAAGQAFAADLPPPAPPPPPRAPATYVPAPAPIFTWTGIYVGLNGGYAFGNSSWSDPFDGSTGNFSTDGFLIGGTLGGNYQFGSFVIGIEGDGDWTNLKGTANGVAGNCFGLGCTTKSEWLATVRGRAGWAWDRILFYGTGGAAFTDVEAACCGLPFNSTTQVGWTAGAGIEAAFTPNITGKIEYLYASFENATCPATSCGGGTPAAPLSSTITLKENIIRAGINYKFW